MWDFLNLNFWNSVKPSSFYTGLSTCILFPDISALTFVSSLEECAEQASNTKQVLIYIKGTPSTGRFFFFFVIGSIREEVVDSGAGKEM